MENFRCFFGHRIIFLERSMDISTITFFLNSIGSFMIKCTNTIRNPRRCEKATVFFLCPEFAPKKQQNKKHHESFQGFRFWKSRISVLKETWNSSKLLFLIATWIPETQFDRTSSTFGFPVSHSAFCGARNIWHPQLYKRTNKNLLTKGMHYPSSQLVFQVLHRVNVSEWQWYRASERLPHLCLMFYVKSGSGTW